MYTGCSAKNVWGRAKGSIWLRHRINRRIRPQKFGHVFYGKSALPGLKC